MLMPRPRLRARRPQLGRARAQPSRRRAHTNTPHFIAHAPATRTHAPAPRGLVWQERQQIFTPPSATHTHQTYAPRSCMGTPPPPHAHTH